MASKRKSFFEQEVEAFERYFSKRFDERDTPELGDADFDDVIRFYSYASRRMLINAEVAQAFVVGLVNDSDREKLTFATQETMQNGFDLAEEFSGRINHDEHPEITL